MPKLEILLLFGLSLAAVSAVDQYTAGPDLDEIGGKVSDVIDEKLSDVIEEENRCKDDEFWPMFSDDHSLFRNASINPSHRKSSSDDDESFSLQAHLFSDDVISGNVSPRDRSSGRCRFGESFEQPRPDGDACCRT